MNIRPTFFFLLILLTAGLLSCKNHTDGEQVNRQPPAHPLFPLAAGKQWSYVSTMYDSLGHKTAARDARTSVVGDTVVDGETWYTLEDDSTQMPMNAANRKDGLYILDQDGKGILLYKYPASVGDACPPYTIVSTDTTVSCAAGRFTCYQYQCVIGGQADSAHSWSATIDDFIAPGVGLVKHEVKREWGEGKKVTPGEREVTELKIED